MSENPSPIEIGLLVFPDVQQLDLTGPYEVFASWPRARVRLVCKTLTPIMSSTRLVLTPDATFESCPQTDVLCVPGGAGINALLTDEEVNAVCPGWVATDMGGAGGRPVALGAASVL
jgi:cyclohexyl-isocyanide hydratase